MTEDSSGYVLHLPLYVDGSDYALRIARNYLRMTVGVFPEFDPSFASITQGGCQNGHRLLYCGRLTEERQRCMQLPGHEGEHSPRWGG